MNFAQDSDITLVVTSCGRFDLLSKTLASFDTFNTAPIREVLITEDSGSAQVTSCIPEHWRPHTQFMLNNPKLGQLASIDLAYSKIKTQWIFHCEDDWAFYRPHFIEDSQTLLQADAKALQVWLRSYAHDLSIHSPYVFLERRHVVSGIAFYRVASHKKEWQGFSFNPGLRRLEDYLPYAPYAQYAGEKDLSRLYAANERYALILENDAVLHTGFAQHVTTPEERLKKVHRKQQNRYRLLGALILGACLGFGLGGYFL